MHNCLLLRHLPCLYSVVVLGAQVGRPPPVGALWPLLLPWVFREEEGVRMQVGANARLLPTQAGLARRSRLVGILSFRQVEGLSQIGSGSFPSGNRRLFVPPLAFLEGHWCRAMGGGSLEVGVCISLLQSSSSVRDSYSRGFVLSPVHQGEDLGGGGSGSSPQGSGGACVFFSGLLQPDVRRHQGVERVETDH